MHAQLVSLVQLTVRRLGGLPFVWIGGGFLDLSREPDDLDVTCLIEHDRLQKAFNDGGGAKAFALALADGTLATVLPLLDVHLLPVEPPFVGAMSDASLGQRKYLAHRGYWDALWGSSRDPSGSPVPADRGYLEVRIDGYR